MLTKDSKRKVLILADSFGNGGAERQLALLVRYLPANWERRVWGLGKGPFIDVIRGYSVQVDVCERKRRLDIRPILDLWSRIAHWRPDVVHSWGWMGGAAALPLCKLLGIPLIASIRTSTVWKDVGMLKKYAQWHSNQFATRVIANSYAGISAWGISADRGHVVYNGFDPERLPLCVEPRDDSSCFSVIMVGRMETVKDWDSFLEAGCLVMDHDVSTSWRFVALGGGTSRSSIMKRAKGMGRKGLFEFPEPTLEVVPRVRQARVGVLMTAPGVTEGFSNAITEYMACGLPVVCSRGGGNDELVIDGVTGFLVPAADPAALAEKLIWLRDKPEVATRIGEAGRRRILGEFSVARMVAETVSVYEETINASSNRPKH